MSWQLIVRQCFAFAFAACSCGLPQTVADPPPSERAANLLANPNFAGTSGWNLLTGKSPASYDPGVSRASGSGAVRLVSDQAVVESRAVRVTPGETYTFSGYMLAEKIPALLYCMAVTMDNSGRWLRRLSTGYYGVYRTWDWEEIAGVFTAQAGEDRMMLRCARYEYPFNPNPGFALWLDDMYVGKGISLGQAASLKRPFLGSSVRVDALGNMDVWRNESWEPFFVFGIYQNVRDCCAAYSFQGFNCIMFNQFDLRLVERARSAVSSFNPYGMMSMIEVAQYVTRGTTDYGDLAGLGHKVSRLVESLYGRSVLAYYWDNEAWSEYEIPDAVMGEIRRRDRDAKGQPVRPILMLQGNSGMLRQYNDMVDAAMTYDDVGDNLLLQRIQEQRLPWTIAVLSNISSASVLRSRFYRALALGARGVAIYSDPQRQAGRPPVPLNSLPVWTEVPQLRSEVDELLPMLRQSQWTEWSANACSPAVTVGTRDYEGEGYVILSSSSPEPVDTCIRLSGMRYRPGALVEFFSKTRLVVTDAREVRLSLPAYGVAVYRIERDLLRSTP